MASRLWTPADLSEQPISWLDCDTCRVDSDGADIVGVYDKQGHSYRPLAGYLYSIGASQINGRRWLGGTADSDTAVRLSLGCLTASGWLAGKPGVTIAGTWWRFALANTYEGIACIHNVDAAGTAGTTQAQAMLRVAPASASNGNFFYNWRRLTSDTRTTSTLSTGLPASNAGFVLSSRLDAETASASIHAGTSPTWGSLAAQTGVTSGALGGCSRTAYEVMLGFERANVSGAQDIALGEFMLWPSALSDADIAKVEGYLAHRWGVADSLPDAHPYKAAPPQVDEPLPPAPQPVPETAPEGFLLERPAKGQTWASLAFRFYYDEAQFPRLIGANPALADVQVFEGTEAVLIPILPAEELAAAEASTPPWRR